MLALLLAIAVPASGGNVAAPASAVPTAAQSSATTATSPPPATAATQAAATATPATAAPLLDRAADAKAQGDGEGCAKLAQDALATGTLDEKDAARAWLLRGACYAIAKDGDKAVRSYAVAIRIDAHLRSAGPSDAAFQTALKSAPPPEQSLAASAQASGDTVEVALAVDDLQLVKSAALVHGDDEVARFPLEASAPKHRISGIDVGGLALVLFDKHGNAIWRANVSTDGAAGEHVVTPAPAVTKSGHEPTVLTTLGATAIGAGMVGIVASGIAVVGYGPKALSDGQPWLVGVGASTTLFLVGACLVVVDQGLGT